MKKPTWPAKPKRSKHPILGTRLTWLRSDGLALVDRFPQGSGRFIPSIAEEPGENFRPLRCSVRTLKGAQKACDCKLKNGKENCHA